MPVMQERLARPVHSHDQADGVARDRPRRATEIASLLICVRGRQELCFPFVEVFDLCANLGEQLFQSGDQEAVELEIDIGVGVIAGKLGDRQQIVDDSSHPDRRMRHRRIELRRLQISYFLHADCPI
jgi:hypothetical protein